MINHNQYYVNNPKKLKRDKFAINPQNGKADFEN